MNMSVENNMLHLLSVWALSNIAVIHASDMIKLFLKLSCYNVETESFNHRKICNYVKLFGENLHNLVYCSFNKNNYFIQYKWRISF